MKRINRLLFFAAIIGLLSLAACNGDDPPPDTPPNHEDWIVVETDTVIEIFNDIEFDTQGNGFIIGDKGTYLTSADAGNTWVVHDPIASVDLNKMHHNGVNKIWIAGDEGTILYSSNNGETWNSQTSPTEGDLNSVFFVNDASGWIVGTYEEIPSIILHTNNGGQGSGGWVHQEPPENVVILNDVYFPTETLGFVVGEYGTIFQTDDAGLNWEKAMDLTIKHLYSVWFVSDETGFAVGQDGIFLNYGKDQYTGEYHWFLTSDLPNYKFAFFDLYSITFANEEIGWTGGENSGMYYTIDGAIGWGDDFIQDVISVKDIYMNKDFFGWAVGTERFTERSVILKYNPE